MNVFSFFISFLDEMSPFLSVWPPVFILFLFSVASLRWRGSPMAPIVFCFLFFQRNWYKTEPVCLLGNPAGDPGSRLDLSQGFFETQKKDNVVVLFCPRDSHFGFSFSLSINESTSSDWVMCEKAQSECISGKTTDKTKTWNVFTKIDCR
jgi:hypothetical protein